MKVRIDCSIEFKSGVTTTCKVCVVLRTDSIQLAGGIGMTVATILRHEEELN